MRPVRLGRLQVRRRRPATGPAGPRTYGGYGSYGGYGYGYDSYGGYGEGGAGAEAHLMDYVRKVYRHRWLALTTFAVIVIGAAVSTFSTTPIYEGRVQLQLDPETPNVMSFKDGMDPAYVYGYEELLLSDAVHDPQEPRAGAKDHRIGESVGLSGVRRRRRPRQSPPSA